SRRGEWPPELRDATLVVNATPVKDVALVQPEPHVAVVDLAYYADGSDTALIASARRAGCGVVIDGLEVLVRQGAASFERWTGLAAPVDVMRAAARAYAGGCARPAWAVATARPSGAGGSAFDPAPPEDGSDGTVSAAAEGSACAVRLTRSPATHGGHLVAHG